MSLLDSFKDIYDKVFTTDAVNTDNLVFKLHYRVTVTSLVIFSVVLSLGQVSSFLPFSITYNYFCKYEELYLKWSQWNRLFMKSFLGASEAIAPLVESSQERRGGGGGYLFWQVFWNLD